MLVKRFDQSSIRIHSRVRCTKMMTVNPNTSYTSTRPCRKSATFYVDNVPMCSAHAGQTLLEDALNSTEAYDVDR